VLENTTFKTESERRIYERLCDKKREKGQQCERRSLQCKAEVGLGFHRSGFEEVSRGKSRRELKRKRIHGPSNLFQPRGEFDKKYPEKRLAGGGEWLKGS